MRQRKRLQHVAGPLVLHERSDAQVRQFPARIERQALIESRHAVSIQGERANECAHHEIVAQPLASVFAGL
jgi:hypothetical protein